MGRNDYKFALLFFQIYYEYVHPIPARLYVSNRHYISMYNHAMTCQKRHGTVTLLFRANGSRSAF